LVLPLVSNNTDFSLFLGLTTAGDRSSADADIAVASTTEATTPKAGLQRFVVRRATWPNHAPDCMDFNAPDSQAELKPSAHWVIIGQTGSGWQATPRVGSG
jgi:hypothetical protein